MRMENKFAIVEHLTDVVNIESLFASAPAMINQALSGLLSAVRDGIVPLVNTIASLAFTVFLGFVLAFWLAVSYTHLSRPERPAAPVDSFPRPPLQNLPFKHIRNSF